VSLIVSTSIITCLERLFSWKTCCVEWDVKHCFVTISVIVVLSDGRLQRLLQEIMGERHNKTMVFVETKRRANDLTYRLKRAG